MHCEEFASTVCAMQLAAGFTHEAPCTTRDYKAISPSLFKGEGAWFQCCHNDPHNWAYNASAPPRLYHPSKF